uniref:Uncharacterized protein n=1 Tax=Geobacter sp. (strain M21) TaxID=443144 RepID=C6E2B7_GEOSM
MVKVGFADFMALCNIDDRENWCGYSVKPDGIYVVVPEDNDYRTPREWKALCHHPAKDLMVPLLTFPCSLNDLRRFVKTSGTNGCIDAFDMAEFVLENAPSSDPKYLDTNRADHPVELAAAIRAWEYAVDLDGDPSCFKMELKEYLRIQGFSAEAINRISTVANPYKRQGAPKRPQPKRK